MTDLQLWLRIVATAVTVLGSVSGLVLWMWRSMQKQAHVNTQTIAELKKIFYAKFDHVEYEIASVKQTVSHQASEKDITKISERLSSIEASQKASNNILTLIQKHILSEVRNG